MISCREQSDDDAALLSAVFLTAFGSDHEAKCWGIRVSLIKTEAQSLHLSDTLQTEV